MPSPYAVTKAFKSQSSQNPHHKYAGWTRHQQGPDPRLGFENPRQK